MDKVLPKPPQPKLNLSKAVIVVRIVAILKIKNLIFIYKKNQTLQITVGSENVDDVVVKNSKGRPIKVEWVDDFLWLYRIQNGGKYTIYIKPHQKKLLCRFQCLCFF